MFKNTLRFILLIVALVFTGVLRADPSDSFALRKLQAIQSSERLDPAAEKTLRGLLIEKPGDAEIPFRLAMQLADKGRQLKPGKARIELMREARKFCVEAKKNGFLDPLVETTLAAINEDGSENADKIAADPQVDRILHEAEEAYARHQFDQAIKGYLAVLEIQPGNYFATLNLGDAYFASNHFPEAIEWFKKATIIDQNRETAYRYCGDALMRLGKKDDALDQYLSAIIAEPYNGYPWRGLNTGLKAFLLKPWPPARDVPVGGLSVGEKGVEIHLSDAGDTLQIGYLMARAEWYDKNHKAKSPKETLYRQTLEEEVHGLEMLLKIYDELKQAEQKPDSPKISEAVSKSMAELTEIKNAGLLEPHILFFRANKDLAQDYPAYRDANREKLKAYLLKFYLHLQ